MPSLRSRCDPEGGRASTPALRTVSVLVVDDSALVRRALTEVLEADPRFVILGAAADAYEAARTIAREVPDVMILDIEMPRMDGLTFLKKVMTQHPIPTVVCSSLAERGSPAALSALQLGAVEVIHKPRLGSGPDVELAMARLRQAVYGAAHANLAKLRGARRRTTFRGATDVRRPLFGVAGPRSMIALGASTGGTDALLYVLSRLPRTSPGVVVTQHMPEGFTASFASYLDQMCDLHVTEARAGDTVEPGRVFVAPGNRHMVVRGTSPPYHVHLHDGPPVTRHRPSVDELFYSVAQTVGAEAVGVLMTGMGDDGARGLLAMKVAGARTIAQDEASCVVFGMPKRAIELDATTDVLSLDDIPAALRQAQAVGTGPT